MTTQPRSDHHNTGRRPLPVPQVLLDGVPGMLVWITFAYSIFSAFVFPRTLLLIAALLGLYTALRFTLAGLANLRGRRLIRQAEATDWYARYQQQARPDALRWEDVHHAVIIPNYQEPEHVLRRTLDRLAEQYEATRRLTIVLAMEEAEEGAAAKGQQLAERYASRFAHIICTIHPQGIPGELRGKSSNIAWAGRQVRRFLVDQQGLKLDHILVTSTDADIIWHPQYFYALTCEFALNPQRHNRIYQAPIRYHGNVWKLNPLMRILNVYSTAVELAYLAADPRWTALPISSYSLSLRLLDDIDYWDVDVISDEWHAYVNSYFVRRGNLKVQPVFLPFLADAATGETLWEAIRARYDQTLRHAWGSKEMGYMLGQMLTHSDMPRWRTFRVLVRISHDILLAGAGWVLITVGSQLPLLLHEHLRPIPLTRILEEPALLIITLAGLVIVLLLGLFWHLDVQSRPPRTMPQTIKERLLTLLSFPLMPILTVVFVSLPTIHAQTQMMLGMGLEFRVTRKF